MHKLIVVTRLLAIAAVRALLGRANARAQNAYITNFDDGNTRFFPFLVGLATNFASRMARLLVLFFALQGVSGSVLAQVVTYARAYSLGPARHIDDLGLIDGKRHLVIQSASDILIIEITTSGFALRSRITNPLSGDWGHMLTVVPDINGDGVKEILTYGRDSQVTGNSTLYVLSGNQSLVSVDGNSASISTLPFGQSIPRCASVRPGSNEILVTTDGKILRIDLPSGVTLQTLTGSSISNGCTWISDVNGDSLPDFLTGGPSYAGTLPLYVISGADTSDGPVTTRAVRTYYDELTPGLGYAEDHNNIAVSFGDVNGDGISELAVGSRLYRINPDGTNYGRVVVFDGATGAVLYRLEPDQTHTNGVYFGNNIVATGDLNGDGIGDFVVSARGYSRVPGSFGDGAIIAFSGVNGAELFRAYGEPGETMGDYEVVAIGDINGDGIVDLAVGSLSNASIWVSQVPVATTSTSISSSSNPAPVDSPVTLTATVNPSPTGGTMSFADNTLAIPSCQSVPLSGASATCTVSYPSAGTRNIVATYSGAAGFASSVSPAFGLLIEGGAPLALTVAIDIKPGSFPNSINLASGGVVPVAILSSLTFDATQVDPATVTLAGAVVKLIGKGDRYSCSTQDVNGDGLPDLVCHVITAQFLIEPGDSIAVLGAKTFAQQTIRGEDSIKIVP